LTVTFWAAGVVSVRLALDTLLTVPVVPPAAGPERAFGFAFALVVVLAAAVVFVVFALATAVLLPEVVLAIPYAPMAIATAPIAMEMGILRRNIR
jgi:hypothetical protein